MGTPSVFDPESLLPLPNAVFHILVALADRDHHGYSIMQDVATRTDGKVRLSAGTLYSSIHRMLEQGLLEELRERKVSELTAQTYRTDNRPIGRCGGLCFEEQRFQFECSE